MIKKILLIMAISFIATGCQIKPINKNIGLVINLNDGQGSDGPEKSLANWQVIETKNISAAADVFNFSVQAPDGWQIQAVPQIEALNIFNPEAEGQDNLRKSQIFIRYFKASDFLTLGTVTIHSRTKTTINGRPAVIYDIEKKSGVANFAHQPSWRSARHLVTDIRLNDTNPSIFYVVAKRPDLAQEIFDRFIISLKPEEKKTEENFSQLVAPVQEFKQRITKKPFGIYITPKTSSIQPEKFTGYHTGADAEFGDVTDEVSVKAIADGVVIFSGTASGYGGVIAIRHIINDEIYVAIYGHLKPNSLVKNNTSVSRGQLIGVLGIGNTSETDGERKHLHFGFHRGQEINLKGYVNNQQDLKNWLDPLSFIFTE